MGLLREVLDFLHWLWAFFRNTEPPPLREWFRVYWGRRKVHLDVSPPGGEPRKETFAWNAIERVCFKAEGLAISDGIYVFTTSRAESYVIPLEADGGEKFWNEILRRKLFDPQLAITAASADEGLFCWPELIEE